VTEQRPAQPLTLTRLRLRGFRNLAPTSFSPGPRFNVLHGDNGQGKSNLLEAIDYLGSLRSFRGAAAADLIQKGAADAELAAELQGDVVPRELRVKLSVAEARQVSLDGKRPRTRAGYLSAVQTVLFHPGDLQLVGGAPELRRTFVDRMLEHFDATYGSSLEAYERALRSRNRLLRADPPSRSAVRAFDELLASAGAVIGKTRARLLAELGPSVQSAFAQVSGGQHELSLRYEPRVAPELDALRKALAESLDKDLARGFTAEGPHADEIAITLDGHLARRFGSQGQQRAIVLALKVAELSELTRRVGRVPILLLDDVSSELDPSRNRRLFELLADLGGQVFLTTTQAELILLAGERVDYALKAGTLTRR
jgi:DNA replication and repair protein RecF